MLSASSSFLFMQAFNFSKTDFKITSENVFEQGILILKLLNKSLKKGESNSFAAVF